MIQQGDCAPDIEVYSSTGELVSSSRYAAQVPYTVVFFKVTCPTCQLALPFLQRVESPERLLIVSQDPPEPTAQFAAKFNAPLVYHFDRAADNYPASNAYGISYVPSIFRIAADGRVAAIVEGFDKSFFESLGIEFAPHENVPAFKPG
jgi:peroxiredoxin